MVKFLFNSFKPKDHLCQIIFKTADKFLQEVFLSFPIYAKKN